MSSWTFLNVMIRLLACWAIYPNLLIIFAKYQGITNVQLYFYNKNSFIYCNRIILNHMDVCKVDLKNPIV